MKNYNFLPFKERTRRLQYFFNQTEQQEEKLIKKMIRQSEREKMNAMKSDETTTDKDREAQEAYNTLIALKEEVK